MYRLWDVQFLCSDCIPVSLRLKATALWVLHPDNSTCPLGGRYSAFSFIWIERIHVVSVSVCILGSWYLHFCNNKGQSCQIRDSECCSSNIMNRLLHSFTDNQILSQRIMFDSRIKMMCRGCAETLEGHLLNGLLYSTPVCVQLGYYWSSPSSFPLLSVATRNSNMPLLFCSCSNLHFKMCNCWYYCGSPPYDYLE